MRMNKRGFVPIIAILIVGVIVAGLAYGVVDTGAITGSSSGYIERPIFKYVKCTAMSDLKYSSEMSIGSSGQWLTKPSVASSYRIIGKTPDKYPDNTLTRYVEYSVCNSQVNSASNCKIYNSQISTSNYAYAIEGIKGTEYVFLTYKTKGLFSASTKSGATYQIGFVPYGLREYDVLGGSGNAVNPNDCTIPSGADSWVDRFISSDSKKITATISKNVNEQTLQPEEERWYVSGYVSSAAESFILKYSNQDAWCKTTGQSAEIYKINTITLGSGTYKIASTDWNDKIGTEICCPGQVSGAKTCSSSFKWVETAGAECSSFKPCGSTNWVPYSEKTLIKYTCDNGFCKSQTKSVECANDFDCKDSNKICDLNGHTCEKANVNIDGQVIETIPDNKADCDAKDGKWITKTSHDRVWYNYVGIGTPKVIVTEYCDTSKPNYLLWIGLTLLAVGGFYFGRPYLMVGLQSLRMSLKGVPFIGRFIP